MADNSTMVPVTFVPFNSSTVPSTEDGTSVDPGYVFVLSLLVLTFACSCYFCCFERNLGPCIRRRFARNRRGSTNRGANPAGNRRAAADIPLPPLRKASATTCLTEQLAQEEGRVSTEETPDKGMEAAENVPMFEKHATTTV
ncbi:hypothetical protein CDAR_221271 [Caerostris darwini]|uniref:Uncharacterized protein n=1 Tax=Caerostris darwini TaxID=1538125 RepID=A0AAV4WLF8_9ARAC|nr:hypothetical protein CDAR_221271 [Caerostris darwini]